MGGALLILAAFLPVDESTSAFTRVSANTLIQQEEWLLPIFGLIVLVAALEAYVSKRPRRWRSVILGLVTIGIVVYLAQDKGLRTLYSLNAHGEAEEGSQGTVVPLGIAIYVAGAGALLATIGGWVMGHSSPAPGTKQCPECAEIILAAAKLCKHCGAPQPSDIESSTSRPA